jgi:hypothetical protein
VDRASDFASEDRGTIRLGLGVKVDNGLEKLNQGLKKAEKVKNSDQTSGSNLRARYTLTTARGAR